MNGAASVSSWVREFVGGIGSVVQKNFFEGQKTSVEQNSGVGGVGGMDQKNGVGWNFGIG